MEVETMHGVAGKDVNDERAWVHARRRGGELRIDMSRRDSFIDLTPAAARLFADQLSALAYLAEQEGPK